MRCRALRFYFACLLSCVVAYSGSLGHLAGVMQSEDPQIISNPKDPVPDKGKRKRLVFREELTIGVEEGDENYMFGESVSVTVDDSGCFFVMDWEEKRIQKYDTKGKYLCSIGRKGQGPGEFGNIWEPMFDSEGNIYATDIVNNRVSFFSKEDGQYRKQIRLPTGMGALILLPNGKYFSSKSTENESEGVMRVDFEYGIFDSDFELLVKFQDDDWHSPPRQRGGSRAEFLANLMSNSAYKPSISSVVFENGHILIGKSDEYAIREYDQEGNLLREISKKDKPKKIDSAHKDFYFEHQVASFLRDSPGGGVELKDEVQKQMEYPKNLPYYIRFQHMDNGWLFVIEDILADTATIDLFDDKGVYVGRFETDIPVITMSFRNGKAYSVTVFDDYKFVKRYSYSIEDY
ncbi:MAG: 6-bladed beta-propeller [Candidatus Aminicenantaceae bacterium]